MATVLGELQLEPPAAAICRDSGGLALLDVSGSRMIRLDGELHPFDTVPISARLRALRGCAADGYYFYVYDNNDLYRMARRDDTLAVWLGNVRVVGLASFAVGEVLASDEDHGFILYKSVFGSSRRFISAADLPRPGALVALPQGKFCGLSGAGKLAFFNRLGLVERWSSIPEGTDLLAADDSGVIYMGQRGRPMFWKFSEGRMEPFALPEQTRPVALVALADRLVILDSSTRLLAVACSQ